MIRGYKKEQVIDTTDNCTYYKATKNGKTYLMQEFDEINESDEYTFKIRKKLSKCSHIVTLEEEFEEKDCKYFISEFFETDLLKLAYSRNGHVLQLPQALEFFARIIEVIDEMHANKLIYRNLRPEKIRFK
jgi:serine/threonine protein kinase